MGCQLGKENSSRRCYRVPLAERFEKFKKMSKTYSPSSPPIVSNILLRESSVFFACSHRACLNKNFLRYERSGTPQMWWNLSFGFSTSLLPGRVFIIAWQPNFVPAWQRKITGRLLFRLTLESLIYKNPRKKKSFDPPFFPGKISNEVAVFTSFSSLSSNCFFRSSKSILLSGKWETKLLVNVHTDKINLKNRT